MKATQIKQPNVDLMYMIHAVGTSAGETIRKYISIRYERWLDYSRYKCSKQKLDEFAIDLLNDVVLNLLQKGDDMLLKLYSQKKVQKGIELTGLDFYVLKAIDINTYSDTAPFRHKNRSLPSVREVKVERLKITNEEYVEDDRPAEIMKQMRLIRWVFNGLNLTVFEHYVFEHKFFLDESLEEMVEWSVDKRIKYSLYSDVLNVIHNILYYYGLTTLAPQKELNDRLNKLCTEFIKHHKIKTSKSLSTWNKVSF